MRALPIVCLILAGCVGTAPVTPSARLMGPSAWTMEAAPLLAAVKEGEDAKELLGQCRAAYGTETAKLPSLQRFARRVTRKPE